MSTDDTTAATARTTPADFSGEHAASHWFWLDEDPYLHPTVAGSVAILLSMVVGYLFMGGTDSSAVAGNAGRILGVGILLSIFFDLRVSLKNLIRLDLGAILALYFLTFAEFIFTDQPVFSETVYVFDAERGILAVYLGFAGLVIGRHLVRPARGLPFSGDVGFPSKLFILMIAGCFFFGNIYAFLSVTFNPFEWFYHLSGARFSQPWARGKYGSWATLLGELQLLLFVVPALAGVIFARARRFGPLQLGLVTLLLLLTLYQAFAGGTRNILAMQLAGFAGGFFIVQRQLKLRPILILSVLIGTTFLFLSHHQLKFRQMGLRLYWNSGMWKQELVPDSLKAFSADEDEGDRGEFEGFFVDLNLRNIAGLTRVFPSRYPYLGINMPFVALTKPVPRAVWPGKPEDFNVGIEEALSADRGYTLSCTFVGEAYMMFGYLGVIGLGLALGASFMAWNRLGSSHDSVYQRLIFASLFIPTLITMRSFTSFSTYLLVPLFLLIVRRYVLKYFAEDEDEDWEFDDEDEGNEAESLSR